MPLYEFVCQECEHSFETLVRPGHHEDVECPSCHGGRLSREMSVFAQHGGGDGASAAPISGPVRGGGGCCGGSCGCG